MDEKDSPNEKQPAATLPQKTDPFRAKKTIKPNMPFLGS